MSEAILVALITAAGAVIAQYLLSRSNSEKLSKDLFAKLDKAQAVTDTKIDELTREVREHNNFARRMPVLEEQIKVANHRISDLEKGDKHD